MGRKRSTNDFADALVRQVVSYYFSTGGSEDDERKARLEIAGILFWAGIHEQVARSVGAKRSWSPSFTDEVQSRLAEKLVDNVLRKADLNRFLSASAMGWARTLLSLQAVRTEGRSEARALSHWELGHPVLSDRAPGNVAMAAGPDQLSELVSRLDADDVELARKAVVAGNLPHLQEFYLRKVYGWARGQLPEDVPQMVSQAVMEARCSLRLPPSEEVRDMFVSLACESGLGAHLAEAWLGQWSECREGTTKTEAEKNRDATQWATTAERALGYLPWSRDDLENILEDMFWQAHVLVGRRREDKALRVAR